MNEKEKKSINYEIGSRHTWLIQSQDTEKERKKKKIADTFTHLIYYAID